eukprot:CAMPEP_0170110526 /NCGR_PEP_ID=MMETSP0020_2-20130122/7907_1 /TAXON_ID=98059 /ORGANISM="Dinobryon sp., Strain UTEXLB2267" /LENGTH=407 /DNA_ID=CAMNT_0010335831 /DNA_START=137 /DNA_END=1360 /DNA_ORIENTATION=+
MFKLCVRKLPVRNFDRSDFEKCIDRLCSIEGSGFQRDSFLFEHFIEGKISRKRGPVFGAGFISVKSEVQFLLFLNTVPSKYPFIEVDSIDSQPEVCKAPNQRVFRFKEKGDRHVDTYETDPGFIDFKSSLEQPVEKRVSAERQLDLSNAKKEKESEQSRAALALEKIRSSPLLKYLREKAAKKLSEKRVHKDRSKAGVSSSAKALLVTSVLSKGGSSKVVRKQSRSESASADSKPSEPPRDEKVSGRPGRDKERRRRNRGGRGGDSVHMGQKAMLVASESALSGGSILAKGTIQQSAKLQQQKPPAAGPVPPQQVSVAAAAEAGDREKRPPRERGGRRHRGGGGGAGAERPAGEERTGEPLEGGRGRSRGGRGDPSAAPAATSAAPAGTSAARIMLKRPVPAPKADS